MTKQISHEVWEEEDQSITLEKEQLNTPIYPKGHLEPIPELS